MSKEQGLNLLTNGKYFPSWILMNFKKYKLEDVFVEDGKDPCDTQIRRGIAKYQDFVGQFLNYRSPFRDILLYHGLGSGKTYNAINIYNVLYNYTPKWNVFLLIPARLRNDPWMKELNKFLKDKNQMENIKFIHYDSPFADRDFLEVVKKSDSSRENIFIIEECHNFIRNVYNNISSKKGKRAQVIYDYIQQEKKDNDRTRIIQISATPVVNNPYEFALIYNLMRPGAFPTSEAIFNQVYISSTNFASLNESKKNQFQRRIMGLTSYYIGATPDKYARSTTHYVDVKMSDYQLEIYNHFEEIEDKKEKQMMKFNRGGKGNEMSTYSSYTRQSANFVFPNINDTVNGEKRPRPGQFRIKDIEANTVDEGKDEKKIVEYKSKETVMEYIKLTTRFVNETYNYFKNIEKEDEKNKHTLADDVEDYKKKYNNDFKKLMESSKISRLLRVLYRCSPKFITAIFNIIKSPGSVLVYSNYVLMEGLQMFKIYLSFFGFGEFNGSTQRNKKYDGFRYCEFHGGIDKEQRELNRKTFNLKENKYGKVIKIIMISPAGAEGITLNNCRQVHIIEPYWNEARIKQVVGRAVRQCVHRDLPLEERTVDVYRYKIVRKGQYKDTADEKMEKIARKKENLLLSFDEAVKETAVDCELFKAHNMMGTKYNCFKFNQESLFEKNVGPAYNINYDYDNKMDNGSNSIDSVRMKIKVKKVSVVKAIDDKTFSDTMFAWLNEYDGVVYDYEMDFPIGRVNRDNGGNFKKLDKKTYIVENIVNVPIFKLYQ